jgi:hypothetical protein
MGVPLWNYISFCWFIFYIFILSSNPNLHKFNLYKQLLNKFNLRRDTKEMKIGSQNHISLIFLWSSIVALSVNYKPSFNITMSMLFRIKIAIFRLFRDLMKGWEVSSSLFRWFRTNDNAKKFSIDRFKLDFAILIWND